MQTIVDCIQNHVKNIPNKIIYRYILDDTGSVLTKTVKELDNEAKSIANTLIKVANRGDRVLLLYPPGVSFMSAFVACLYSGIVAVPIYPPRKREKVDRLRRIIADCDPKAILTTEKIEVMTQEVFKDVHDLNYVPFVISDNLLNQTQLTLQSRVKEKEEVAFLQYTSGSTGTPKGVMVTHANIMSNMKILHEIIGNKNKNTLGASWLPHFHDMGLIGGVFLPLYLGREAILMAPIYFLQKPIRWFELISKYKVNVIAAPNFAYEMCANTIKDEDLDGIDLSSLTIALTGAEPISPSTIEKFTNKFAPYGFNSIAHYPCYGMAETTLFLTGIEVNTEAKILDVDTKAFQKNIITIAEEKNKNRSTKIVSCGTPRLDHEVVIVNKSKDVLIENEVGEILARGSSVTKGYWQNKEKTKEDFDVYIENGRKGPFFKTGDLGFLHNGELFVCGRVKDLIIIRGKNYYPQDIEVTTYTSHKALAHMGAVAFSIEDKGMEKLIILQEIDRKYLRKYNAAEIFKTITEAVAEEHQLQIEDIVLLKPGKLFKTSSGKIQRFKNKKSYLNNTMESLEYDSIQSNREYVAPRNETEEKLAKIFQEVLNVEKVGIYDNFFELGGHSLLATQLVSRIRNELEIELPLKELFQTPTIENLCLYLQEDAEKSTLAKIPLVEDRSNLQLSYAQERLWFLDKFEGGESTTYHIPAVLKIEGKVNKKALHQALRTIVERHEALRTNFVEKDKGALQIIREVDTFSLEEIRCKESSIQTKIKETLTQSFNLESDMLFKAVLYTINEQTHYLLVNMHHIVSDGWSIGILVQEFVTLYTAYSNKQENPLPPLEIQYADYAAWQREYLSGEVLEEKLNYWKDTLGGIEPLALATTYPRPAIQSSRGDRISFSINKEITRKLNILSKKYDTTLFMTLLSSFGLLLHKYSGQEEFIIGSPIANRNRFEIEPLIGFFVNTLALKQDFSSDMKFSTVLQQTKEHTLSAYDHQDVPFEKIVDALDIPRDTSRSPLFQVMFVLQNNPENTALELADLKIEGVAFENPTSKFDLTMDITEANGKLYASLEYATDLFSQTYIESMIEHFKILLEAIVKDETQAISQYPILTKQEEQQLLIEYNDTKVAYPKDKTIHQLFEAQVKLNPENVAVVYEDEELTYKQLNTKSNQLAHYLIEQGVEPDSLVAICVDRSLDMMIGLLAILKAGGAYVPIDPTYPEDRIKHMLEDSQAKILLTQAHLEEILPKTKSKTIAIDTLKLGKNKKSNPKTKVTSSNLAYVIYTSGSTGLPKGVMVEHGGVVNYTEFISTKLDRNKNYIAGMVSIIATDLGNTIIFPIWNTGNTLHLFREENILDKDILNKYIQKNFINILKITPSHYESLDIVSKDLEILFLGGENLNKNIIKKISKNNINVECYNHYGPTESTVGCSIYNIKVNNENSIIPIGRPINNTQLYILDKHLNLVPKGVAGELHIAGDGLARGYLNQPTLTKEKFIDNPFNKGTRLYKTGDLVRYLEDGNIEYIGRIDDQVKIRGFRIELGEIEQQLLKVEEIKESVVLAKEEENGNKSLVAYISTEENQEIESSSIKSTLSQHLPEYMIPVAYKTIESMPLTPNGKVDKKALVKLEVEIQSSKEYVAPRNETEEKLAKIFQEVLNVEKVGIYDNFFELGGHSLLATQLVSRIRNELEIELPLKELFQTPTIENLCLYLQEDAEKSTLAKIPLVEDRSNLQLSYAQERLWFLDKFEGGESTTYHIPAVLKIEGKVNKKALHQALRTIVERHEALRTNFVEKDEGALQIIREVDTFSLEEIRCKESSIQTKIKETLTQSFNLESDMLFKAVLYTINEQTHYLLVNMHHIVSDGWSIGILVQEFVTLYTAYSNKQENPLPPLEIQYADYAAWQREYLSGEVLEEKLNYWKDTLGGIEPLALATTYPRPAIQSNRGDRISFSINKEITRKLNILSKKYDTTLFMTLLSSFGLLLHKYSGQEEFIIGSPIANRNRFEIEPLIGFFVNTLALKQDFSSDMKFSTVLQQTKEHTLSAYDHQDVPFEKIVDALDIPRDTSRSPLFQVMFVLQNNPENTALELADLKIEGVAFENPTSKFDLTMNITEANGKLYASLEYATDLFSQTYIESMIEHFKILLEAIVKDETQAISQYPILTKQEEQQLLIEYNDTKVAYPKDKTIHQLFEAQVKLNPENVAVVYEDEELTYKQLNTKSNQLAHYLIEQGVEPDSLVAICVDRSLDMMIGLLAILKAGGAYVPIDPTYPEDRIKHMLEDSQAKILLTQAHLEEILPKTKSKTIAIDTLKLGKNKKSNPKTKVTSSNLAYVIYTSGSTGLPKGVMVEHGGVVNYTEFISTKLDRNKNYIAGMVSIIATDLGNTIIFPIWNTGNTLHLFREENILDKDILNKYIQKNFINILKITPSHYESLDIVSKDLEILFLGGENLNKNIIKKISKNNINVECYNHYGPTESTVGCSIYNIKVNNENSIIPIGRPINNTQLYILDKHLNLVPKGVAGELHIAGDGLARGYLNQPTLTKEKFIDNPFNKGTRLYKTGDLVRYLEDGNIEYIGRIDDQVKIRGFRIELGEIEQQLLKVEEIKESVVLAKEEENGNKSLVAYISTEENQEIESSSIKSTLSQHLPEYMIPVAYKTIESMPLTPNGKVDKKALVKLEVEIQSSKEYVAPRNETEEKLAKIFQEVLNVEKVGIYDNFFELGGHSLLATQLVSRIRNELEIELPLKELFQTPTIENLCLYLQEDAEKSTLAKIPLVEDRSNLQLSYAQERLWFLDKFEGGESTTYHIPAVLKIEGKVNKKALHQALRTIVERHEALRTNFVEKDEGALQIIREVDTFSLEEIRCKESSIQTKIKETLTQSFNLESDTLFKAVLYTINEQTHYLLVNMHHIVSDGWSIGILVQEFVTLYTAYSNKQENPLPPLEIQYADYAAWQREYLSGEVLEEKLNYWKDTLGGIEPLALATTYPRPAIQSNRGDRISFSINKEITRKLNILSKKYDTTLFMTLLSSFGLLLHKYSGQEEFIIGSPIANRNRFEIEPLIGFFVNTLALKQDFSSDMKFSTVLQQTKEHTLSAYDHQDVPFEKIVDALDIPRDTSRSPLFQVMFVLQNNPENTALELADLKIEGVAFENPTSKFDLTMNITEANGKLYASLEYATDLFSQTYIESMIEHFKILLEAIVKDETQAISQYPILTKQEEQQLLIEYNDTKVAYPKDKTIHQLFEAQVKLNPENVAVVYEDEELTYKQLNTKSNQLAHYLIEQGVEPDSLVAICVDRSLDMMIGLLAILKAGGAYVPIDPTYPEDRIKHMLEDSQAKILLTQAHLEEILPKTKSKTIAIDTLKLGKNKKSNPKTKVTSSNLAYVIYTSGSTGLPKGVMVEHGGVVNRLDWMQKEYQINEHDIILQKTPFSFDVSVWELFLPLMYGLKEVIAKPEGHKDSEYLTTIIEKEKITMIHFVPSMLSSIYDYQQFVDITSLKQIISSGEVLALDLVNKYYEVNNVTIHNLYGPTEASIEVSSFRTYRNMPYDTVPIGRPINNTQLYILDKHLNLVPKGVAGELHIAGDGLARGYLNQPTLTKEKFIDNPFNKGTRLYKTGDLVRYLEDGNIEYIGRIDDQVKIRGFRIELGEIEQQLLKVEEIKESVVLAKEEENGNKSLVAYISTEENQEIESSSIKSTLSQHLPEYMIPVAYKTIESMPLTPNGKVDKKALVKLEVEIQSSKEYVAPRNETEEKLAKIFQEVLNVEKVGVYDNFFELGGHSLLAISMITKIEYMFNVNLEISILFRYSTVFLLHNLLKEKNIANEDIIVNIQTKGKKPPIFGIHGVGGDALSLWPLSNKLGVTQPFYGLKSIQKENNSLLAVVDMYIKAIREIQSEGPYFLLGHSLGGIYAYEMACKLQTNGEEVYVLLLDTQLNLYKKQKTGDDENAEYIYQICSHLAHQNDITFPHTLEDIKKIPLNKQRDFIVDSLALCGISVSHKQVNHFIQTYLTAMKELNNHMLTIINEPMNIALFSPYSEKNDYSWNKILKNKIKIYKVSGNHTNMIKNPNVQLLANTIKKYLYSHS